MKSGMRKALAGLLAAAMVLSGSNLMSTSASAASKKAKLSLNKTKVTIEVGKKTTLKITKKNVKKIKKTTWTTSKKSVAKVSNKGVVTAKAAGTAVIKAKVKYKATNGKKYVNKVLKCTVKVNNAAVAATVAPTVATTVAPAAPTAAASAAPTAEVTVAPTAEPTETPFVPLATLPMKSDDTSNVGEARTVTIVGGTSESMEVKDNGTMRKDLSSQYLILNEMGAGINLGNTMEAVLGADDKANATETYQFETAWGAPVTTQEYIDAVHSYGFNTIRIPVAWTNMVKDDDTTYTIDEKYLGRVEEIVNYALNDGMYVIVNDHWDNGWWSALNTSADTEKKRAAYARYESYWKQISARFADYSDHLILESANEELYSNSVNTINQKFVDIVRSTMGNTDNNKYRHLLLAGIRTDIDKTVSDDFVMPTDLEENGTTKMSVSVHYYTPWDFCGDGMDGADYTEDDKAYTIKAFNKLKKFTDAGYGVIVGEMGVCNPKQDGTVDWLRDTIQIAYERGCTPVIWETTGMYFDRENCVMKYKDVADMYKEITGATVDTSNITMNTGKPLATITPIDLPADAQAVWSWNGEWQKNNGNIGLDGSLVTGAGVDKFVNTTSCTDASKLVFNDWGYQAYLGLDWSQIKSPCLKFTFDTDNEDVVGDLVLSTTAKAGKTGADVQHFTYETWAGKAVIIPDSMIESLKTNGYLEITFGVGPRVKSIEVYDISK